MELEFKRSVLKQLKYYKKKNPEAYKIIIRKVEEILDNLRIKLTKKLKNTLNINVQDKEIIGYALKF